MFKNLKVKNIRRNGINKQIIINAKFNSMKNINFMLKIY